MNRKRDVTLKWLIKHECVNYMGAQDDPCDLAV